MIFATTIRTQITCLCTLHTMNEGRPNQESEGTTTGLIKDKSPAHMLVINFAVRQADRHVASRGWPAGRMFTQHLKGAGVVARKQTAWQTGPALCPRLRLVILSFFNTTYV